MSKDKAAKSTMTDSHEEEDRVINRVIKEDPYYVAASGGPHQIN